MISVVHEQIQVVTWLASWRFRYSPRVVHLILLSQATRLTNFLPTNVTGIGETYTSNEPCLKCYATPSSTKNYMVSTVSSQMSCYISNLNIIIGDIEAKRLWPLVQTPLTLQIRSINHFFTSVTRRTGIWQPLSHVAPFFHPGSLGIYLRTLPSASCINFPVTAFLTTTTGTLLLTTSLSTTTLLFYRLLTLMLLQRICSSGNAHWMTRFLCAKL
jgi:hypothetical protein